MNSVERYKKRKALLKDKNIVSLKPINYDIVHQLTTSKVDTTLGHKVNQIMEEHYHLECDFTVTKEEAKAFLEQFKKDFNQERFDKLIVDCKKEVINSIVNPFGLGKIVAVYDKVGGNVTTLHNFEVGIVATIDDKHRHDEWKASNTKFNRQPYDEATVINANGKELLGNFNTNKKKTIFNSMNTSEEIIDGYNDTSLGIKNENSIEKKGEIDLEHITSTKEIEIDSKNHLFAEGDNTKGRQSDRVKLATDDNNLTLIDGGMNSSKNDTDLMKWANSPISKKHAKETGNPNMTNAEYYELNPQKIQEQYNKSKRHINKTQLQNQVIKQGKELALTGAIEASKMGVQQAIGLVMTEFFTAVFDELLDIYKNGFSSGFEDDRFFNILKERLKNIAKKLKAKWKDVALAFKDGFISGFISNLVTTAINMFITTGKRIIRIIREGIYSLFKAIKLLIFPPENMTYEEAMHEAKKVIASGLIISLGVVTEQYVDALIKSSGILSPYADILSTIFVGAITGLATTMAVYYIDQQKNDKDAINSLILQTENSLANSEVLLAKLMS